VTFLNLTAEEKLMYGVMKAIYDSAIPISFKGSMVPVIKRIAENMIKAME